MWKTLPGYPVSVWHGEKLLMLTIYGKYECILSHDIRLCEYSKFNWSKQIAKYMYLIISLLNNFAVSKIDTSYLILNFGLILSHLEVLQKS